MRISTLTVIALVLCAPNCATWATLPPPPGAGYTAETFTFACIGNGCALTPPIGDQLFVQVVGDAHPIAHDPNIYFKFWNFSATPSSVVQVSIQGISLVTLFGGSGVNFNSGTSTPLPDGNTTVPPFVADVSFVAIPGDGINSATDDLELTTSSATFGQVISGVESGSVRFGLFATDFPNLEVGATYINTAQAVPEPGASVMMLAALAATAALSLMSRLRRSASPAD